MPPPSPARSCPAAPASRGRAGDPGASPTSGGRPNPAVRPRGRSRGRRTRDRPPSRARRQLRRRGIRGRAGGPSSARSWSCRRLRAPRASGAVPPRGPEAPPPPGRARRGPGGGLAARSVRRRAAGRGARARRPPQDATPPPRRSAFRGRGGPWRRRGRPRCSGAACAPCRRLPYRVRGAVSRGRSGPTSPPGLLASSRRRLGSVGEGPRNRGRRLPSFSSPVARPCRGHFNRPWPSFVRLCPGFGASRVVDSLASWFSWPSAADQNEFEGGRSWTQIG